MGNAQTRFVVCGIQRTGTTLLIGMLDAHPEVFCVGELFQNSRQPVQHARQRYRSYVESSLLHRAQHFAARGRLMSHYLESVLPSGGYRAVGFKLMYNHSQQHPHLLDALKSRSYKVVVVVRENLLKTCVSRLRARQTGLYASQKPVEPTKMQIPVELLLAELDRASTEDQQLREVLAGLCLPLITIRYEQLAAESRQMELQRIWAFLGVDDSVRPAPGLTKLSPDDLSQSVENYDQVVEALVKTEYARYL